jgi:two-component system sensor histidine kinase VicK
LIAHIPSSVPEDAERTEVYYGAENVIDLELRFFLKTKRRIDTCMSPTRPSLAVGIESIKKSFVDARNRGVKLRYLTEITKDNIDHCRELMEIIDEFRHLEGIRSNFMLSESEYLAPVVSNEDVGKIASEIIYSNIKSFVDQQQYLFDMLWNKAIPAEQKIREIEEGIMHYETRIIENPDEIIKEISSLTATSNELSTCITAGGMQYSYNHFFEIKKKLLAKQTKGEHKGIRYVSNIDKDIVNLVKVFLKAGIQIRHIKNPPAMSFGVSDKEIAATIEKMEGGRKVQSLLVSNEPLYVSHFSSVFEELWKNGIEAKDRIKYIEEGIESTNIEIIENPRESLRLAYEVVRSAKEEVLRMYPSINAFHRQVRVGAMRLFKEVLERGIRVRILIPADEEQIRQIVNEVTSELPHIDIRSIDKCLQSHIGIIVVDRKQSLIVESRDDTKDNYYDAAGLAAYSNSKPIALSYASIFDVLWKQTELFAESKAYNTMQQEFIDIAAHELRTPIQPIISLADVLSHKVEDVQQRELVSVLIRNAKRLRRLTEDILDVTKIESSSLSLNKEVFNLNEIIINTIDDIRNSTESEPLKNVKLLYEPLQQQQDRRDIFIEADKARITQVVFNLLNNAAKFTEEGTISIRTSEKKDNNNDQKEVIVSIKDTGRGIHPEIFPRLFSKFAAKSETGTGLGLFISKSIIEAHGGRIWAENNNNNDLEKGATFYFRLPISVNHS